MSNESGVSRCFAILIRSIKSWRKRMPLKKENRKGEKWCSCTLMVREMQSWKTRKLILYLKILNNSRIKLQFSSESAEINPSVLPFKKKQLRFYTCNKNQAQHTNEQVTNRHQLLHGCLVSKSTNFFTSKPFAYPHAFHDNPTIVNKLIFSRFTSWWRQMRSGIEGDRQHRAALIQFD